MFNLHDYIMKLIKGSIGNEPDYKIRENSLKWLDKGVLSETDLEEIDNLLEERKNIEQEETELLNTEVNSNEQTEENIESEEE